MLLPLGWVLFPFMGAKAMIHCDRKKKKKAAALGLNGNSDISRMVCYIVFFFPKLQVKYPKDNHQALLRKHMDAGVTASCRSQMQSISCLVVLCFLCDSGSHGVAALSIPGGGSPCVPSQGPCLPALD